MPKIHTLLSSISTPKKNDGVKLIATKKSFLSSDECNIILKLGNKQKAEAGALGDKQEIIDTTRQSNVTYLLHNEENHWLYQKIDSEIQQVNTEAYKYELSGIEAIQLATYDEDDHYDWHMDIGVGDNSTRKLSLSVQLTPPTEYDGGELEFMKVNEASDKQQGSIIFFPSFLHHRIKPVTRGRRYSLVAWVHGDAFK